MSDELRVVVAGQDGVSKVFQEIAKASDKMANDISKDAAKAKASFRDLASAAKTELTIAGASAAALGIQLAQSTRAQDVALSTLKRSYGDAADGMKAYADQIQATTNYSNDAAVQSANIFGTLARNYGMGAEEVQRLIQISTDLAATSGLGLEDVSGRVAAAIRGEAEAAEALGLTMNQQSIDRDNLTLGMSNEEAALFRLNALYGQASFAQGAAAEQASKTRQAFNEIQDAGQWLVGASGPIGDVAAALADTGSTGLLAATSFISIAKAASEASKAAGGMGAAMKIVGLAAAGPVGIAVGLGLAGFAAYKLSQTMGNDLDESLQAANASAATLDTSLASLTATMSNAELALNLTEGDAGLDKMREQLTTYKELVEFWGQTDEPKFPRIDFSSIQGDVDQQANYDAQQAALDQIAQFEAIYGKATVASDKLTAATDMFNDIITYTGPGAEGAMVSLSNLFDQLESGEITFDKFLEQVAVTVADLPNYDAAALAAAASSEKLAQSVDVVSIAFAKLISSGASGTMIKEMLGDLPALSTAMGNMGNKLSGDALTEFQKSLGTLISYTGPAYRDVQQGLDDLTTAYLNNSITAEQYAAGINSLANNELPELEAKAIIASLGLQRLNEEGHRGVGVFAGLARQLDATGKTGSRAAAEAKAAWLDYIGTIGHTPDVDEAGMSMDRYGHTVEDAAGGLVHAADGQADLNDEMRNIPTNTADLFREQEKAAAAFADQVDVVRESLGLMNNLQSLKDMGLDGASLDVAVNLTGGGDQLDTVFRQIVGQTNAMSSQLEGVGSWADKLIGDPGVWSDMDKLLADGRISMEQYTAAQEAQVGISEDVTAAQEDLKAVQVALAPVIADATHQQAEYIKSLQGMDSQSQLTALGMMDQATSTKALNLAQLATMVTTKQMASDTGDLIEQAAAADPALRAILQTMGLLDENGDATLTINSNAEDQLAATKELTGAVDGLTAALENVPGSTNTDISVSGTDAATSYISGFIAALNSIPRDINTNVTTTTYTVQGANGTSGTRGVAPEQRNGGITGYANGGLVPVKLAEAGMEMLGFRDGTSAVVSDPGIYMVERGTSVTPAPATAAKLENAARAAGGGGQPIYVENLYIYPTSDDIGDAIGSALRSSYRGN